MELQLITLACNFFSPLKARLKAEMGNFPHSHTPAAFFQTQLAEQLIELPSTDLGFSGITEGDGEVAKGTNWAVIPGFAL